MNFSSALVTGATGFIGRALVRRLSNTGISVVCLVRAESRAELPSNVHTLTVQTFEPKAIMSVLQGVSAEVVFHLAAYGVKAEERDPLEMVKVNIESTAALLAAIKEWPLKCVVYTGSCAEYGIVEPRVPVVEDHPLKPQSLYGAAKLAASIYGSSLAAYLRIPFLTLRLFGVYGPGEANYRLVPYLINHLQKKQRVDLTPGQQVRDFIYVEDVIDALLIAADSKLESGSYNVCSGVPIKVRDVVLQVAAALGCSSSLLDFGARPYRPDEVMWLVGDNTAFRMATGWLPKTPLDRGLSLMITASEAR